MSAMVNHWYYIWALHVAAVRDRHVHVIRLSRSDDDNVTSLVCDLLDRVMGLIVG